MRSDLAERVEHVLSAVGLLLVFVLALFNLSYPRVKEALDEELPARDRPMERQRVRSSLKRILVTGALPPLVVNLIVAYSLAPLARDVIADGHLSAWDFDEMLMTFVLIYALIIAFTVWEAILAVRIMLKVRRLVVSG
jgi:hypothetical protein